MNLETKFNTNSLFSYMGNKQKMLKGITLPECEIYTDAFAGSCSFLMKILSQEIKAQKINIAERDHSILSILHCCQDEDKIVELKNSTIELRDKLLDDPVLTWYKITSVLSNVTLEAVKYPQDCVRIAANKLVYQKFSHGSSARTNKNGIINVIASPDKLKNGKNWMPTLPWLGNQELFLCSDWKEIREEPKDNSLVFIDPPYYLPSAGSCYAGHNPSDIKTLFQLYKAVEHFMNLGYTWIYITHYFENEYHEKLIKIAQNRNYCLSDSFLGEELKSLSYGRSQSTNNKDNLWIFKKS